MLHSQRHLFSLPEDLHYLNCAFKAPLLKPAEEAAIQALVRNRNPSTFTPQDFFSNTAKTRDLFARLVNCAPEEVALIPSASYGLASAINNIPHRPGSHALTIQSEFPSGFFELQRWCGRHGAELKVVGPEEGLYPHGRNWNERILEAIWKDTAMVVMSSVHWMTGLKYDLEAIGQRCREVGACFVVDGSQSVGAMPIDVRRFKIDALICPAYKWMLGPYSIGLAYLGASFDGGVPLEESWMNRTNAVEFAKLADYEEAYKPHAGRYNMGESSNFVLVPMLNAALEQLLEWGVGNVAAYAEGLGEPLRAYLRGLGVVLEEDAYRASHLSGLRLPEGMDVARLKERLAANGVNLSVRGDSLRVSIHAFNTAADVAALVAAVGEAME